MFARPGEFMVELLKIGHDVQETLLIMAIAHALADVPSLPHNNSLTYKLGSDNSLLAVRESDG